MRIFRMKMIYKFIILITSIFATFSVAQPAFASFEPGQLNNLYNGLYSNSIINESKLLKPYLSGQQEEIIDPQSGSLTFKETDISLPGKDGLDLSIARIYNSSQSEMTSKRARVEYEPYWASETVKGGWYAYRNGYNLITGELVTEWYAGTGESDCHLYANLYWDDPYDGNVRYESTYHVKYFDSYTTWYEKFRIVTISYPDKYNYLESRYNLGYGWALALPSVQIEQGNLYFHDGTGAVYEVESSYNWTDSTGTNLKNYPEKTVAFKSDNGSYNNGQVGSSYKLITADQRTTYFSLDGRLIGIKDRFGNEIKFTHVNRRINGVSYPFISRIQDSVGRIIEFSYEDTINDSDAIFNGEKITVRVNDPQKSKSLSFEYTKWRTESTWYEDGKKWYNPYLWRVNNRHSTYYNYLTNGDSADYDIRFRFDTKNLSSDYAWTSPFLLSEVIYPNKETNYKYSSVTRNLGNEGACTSLRVTARYDYKRNVQGILIPDQLNRADYNYINDYSGYNSRYYDDDNLPSSYTYGSELIINGLKETMNFNGTRQHIKTEQLASNGEKKTTLNKSFDANFKIKPTLTEMYEYSNSDQSNKLNLLTTYNEWGGVESTTLPMSDEQLNNPSMKEKLTTKFTYHPKYKFVTEKSWFQDVDDAIPLKETYIYDDVTGRINKTIKDNEITNYSYSTGSEGDIVEVTKALENGKLAKTVTVLGIETGRAYPTVVKTCYTNESNVSTQVKLTKTYNMLFGQVESETDDKGSTTTYEYDQSGILRQIRLPDIFKDREAYSVRKVIWYSELYREPTTPDKNHATICVTSWDLYTDMLFASEGIYNKRESYYDAFGNLVLQQLWDPKTNKWILEKRYRHDNFGRPVSFTDAEGNRTDYAYDAWGRVDEILGDSGNLYKKAYDVLSRKESSYIISGNDINRFRTNPNDNSLKQNVLETAMDQWGRVIERKGYPNWPAVDGVVSERFTYDLVGSIKTYINPDGYATKYQYDSFDRLKQVENPLSEVTVYGYTKLGQLNLVTQKEGAKTYNQRKEFDELGNLKKSTDPGGISDMFTYNGLGQLVKKLDPNRVAFTFDYDRHNRLVAKSANADRISFDYGMQPFGVQTAQSYQASALINELFYTYNSDGTVQAVQNEQDGYINSVNYKYDKTGKVLSVQDPFSFSTSYSYDGNRVCNVSIDGTEQSFQYEYYPSGKVKSITYPEGSGLKTLFEYDGLARVKEVVNLKDGQVLSGFAYTYDSNGNIVTVTDATGTTTYGYDKLNRLISVNGPRGNAVYTYDSRGNRKTDKSSLTTVKDDVYYEYNVWNQLEHVKDAVYSVDFTYDSIGLRTKKTTADETIRYHYNTGGKVIAESDADNMLIAHYAWGPDRLLMKKEADGSKYYYLYNGHGDVVQIVDINGNVVNQYQYDEWGNITDQTEMIQNSFKYAGEQYDDETGLYYLRARYYDPSVGRFINKDTYEGDITNPLSLNLYTYVVNNPLIYVDPSGNMPTAMEAARMAQHIYSATDMDYNKSLYGGWQLIDIIPNDEGLKMGVYSRVKKDGYTEYALVNKGTDTGGDWVNNIQQPIGYSDDMRDSIAESTKFVNDHMSNEITMVGHSKGGAEAIANAVANNKNCITFNTAIPYLGEYGLDQTYYSSWRTMDHYVVRGEILNYLFGKPSIGKTIILPTQHEFKWWYSPKRVLEVRVDNHSMSSVISALREKGYR